MSYVGAEDLDVVDLVSDDKLEDDVSNVGAADLTAKGMPKNQTQGT
jgi:hypothetical protein